ncbi:MAG: 2-isopropylmalate synthase, partial [Leptospiraceae bacterium]|nr:2-isopropylmalate synthase [Leptospiraceae bacterium]
RYIGEFKDGFPNGEGLLIFSNGSSISGSFQNGKVHGFATEFDEKRRLIYSGEWIQGQKKTGL